MKQPRSRNLPHSRPIAHHGSRRTTRKRSNTKSKLRNIRRSSVMVLLRAATIVIIGLLSYLVYSYVVLPYSAKWRALYGSEVYPEGYSIRGIDVSHHQGLIDWEKLSRSTIGDEPICFVFVKATEGKNHLDEYFNENFYQAREYGLLRGAYHYFKPRVPAAEQADYFLKQVHLEEGDLPPVLDIEETGGLTPEQLRSASLVWLRKVEERYHVPPVIYTNYKFKQDYLSTSEFDRYPYWIAHYYVKKLAYKGKWRFWQHTDCGRLDGIREKVDFNIYNGSMYELKRLCLESDE